jgi:TPR repeat protein
MRPQLNSGTLGGRMDLDELRTGAERGSVVSQSILGICLLLRDDGVTPDHQEAFQWLSIAAGRGAARPSVWLGRMYEDGLATEKDLERARELYRFGAERGEFFGCVFLARSYAHANPENEPEARRWYAAALEIFPEWPDGDDDQEFREARAYVSSH